MQHHPFPGLARPFATMRPAARRGLHQARRMQLCFGPGVASPKPMLLANVLVEMLHVPAHVMRPVLTEHPIGRVRLIAAFEFEFSHPHVRSSAEVEYPFIDLVRSSDVVISKPGYGLVMESACNGVPIVLVSRPGWPEETSFWAWLARHGRVLMLTEEKLRSGDFVEEIQAIQAMPSPPIPRPSGIIEAAAVLSEHLG
jgi:hypothetical protein